MMVWMNRECGNIHKTFESMWNEACAMYDVGDPTNEVPLDEYYEPIWVD